MPSVLDVKAVIRCHDFEASSDFYGEILGFRVVDEWEEAEGKGMIFSPGGDGSAGSIEIYAMSEHAERYNRAFSQPFVNDKIDIQLRTKELDSWMGFLRERWPFTGPEITPWGHRWIKLRDPDHLLLAIYEEVE